MTGDPIYRALVQVSSARPNSVFTDREGRFEITNVSEPTVTVDARKPGFFNEQQLRDSQRSSQKLVDASTAGSALTIQLVPEGIITGRVTAQNGEPIERINVKVMRFIVRQGRKQWETSGRINTDDQGEFRIAGLKAGSYFLQTGAKFDSLAFALQRIRMKREGYVPTFYSGVTDVSSANPIAIQPGTLIQLDISLKETPVFAIAGIIKGVAPGQQVSVELGNKQSEEPVFPVQHFPNGSRFRALAPAGFSTLTVRTQNDPDHLMYAEKIMEVASDLPDVYVELSPLPPILVSVRVEATKPPEKRNEYNGPFGRSENVSLSLVPVDGSRRIVGMSRSGNPPMLAIRNLDPGKYNVEVTPTQGSYYVQSIFRGNVDLSREELTYAQGDSFPIEITLRDDGASLTGSVRNASAGATVIIVPDRSPLLYKVTSTNQDGGFQQRGLGPGEYKIFAFENVDDLEYANPLVLAEYSGRAAHVSLEPNQAANITVELIGRPD